MNKNYLIFGICMLFLIGFTSAITTLSDNFETPITGYDPSIWTFGDGTLFRNTTFFHSGTSSLQVIERTDASGSYIKTSINMTSPMSCTFYVFTQNYSLSGGMFDGIYVEDPNAIAGWVIGKQLPINTLNFTSGKYGDPTQSFILPRTLNYSNWTKLGFTKLTNGSIRFYMEDMFYAEFYTGNITTNMLYLGKSGGGSPPSQISMYYDDFLCTNTNYTNAKTPTTNFTITAYDNVSSIPIMNFSALINGTLYYSNVSNGNIITPIVSNLTALINISINSSGYNSLTYTNYNVSSALTAYLTPSDYDSILTIRTNSFNYSAYLISSDGYVYNYSTSTNNLSANIFKNKNYTITIYPNNLSQAINTTYAYNMQSNLQNLSINIYQSNSVNISIYNVNGNYLITGGVDVIITSSSSVRNYSTTTGNLFVSGLDLGINEIKASNIAFAESRYNVYIENRTTQSLKMYLSAINSTNNITFTFYDPNGAIVRNVYVTESALSNDSYILTMSGYTDIEGTVYFSYNPSFYYLYNFSHPSFISSPFYLNPPRKTAYFITMQYSSGSVSYSYVNVSGNYIYNNITEILTFAYVSQDSNLGSYSYTISKVANGNNVIICSGSSVLLSNSFNCDLNGYNDQIFIQAITNNTNIFYGQWLDLGNSNRLSSKLNMRDAALIVGLLTALIIFGALSFGIFGVLVGGVLSIVIMFWLNILSPITITFLIIDIIVSIIIAIALKRRA